MVLIYKFWSFFLSSFEDVIDVVLPTRDTIQINLKNKSVVLFTNRVSVNMIHYHRK